MISLHTECWHITFYYKSPEQEYSATHMYYFSWKVCMIHLFTYLNKWRRRTIYAKENYISKTKKKLPWLLTHLREAQHKFCIPVNSFRSTFCSEVGYQWKTKVKDLVIELQTLSCTTTPLARKGPRRVLQGTPNCLHGKLRRKC